jgi:redox-sensitive bicupin YhaK (pirin superfamily)
VQPRYDQITLNADDRKNKLQQILSPNPDDAGVWIHQDAWFHMSNLSKDAEVKYEVKKKANGVYAFIIEGDATINGQKLNRRDALEIWNTDQLTIKADNDAEILLIEVPMQI